MPLIGLLDGEMLFEFLTGELFLLFYLAVVVSISIETEPNSPFVFLCLSFEDIDNYLNLISDRTEALSIGLFPSYSFFFTD